LTNSLLLASALAIDQMARTEANKRLFVKFFPPETTDIELQNMFSQYGTIHKFDRFEQKNIAFIEFTTNEDAGFALYDLNNKQMRDNYRLRVSWANKKDDEKKKRGKREERVESNEEAAEEKKKKVVEEGPKEIERPETPVGFAVVNTNTRTTKPKTKAKQAVAQEIHYPTVETPVTPPTQAKTTKAKAKTTNTTTTTQTRNGSPQTGNGSPQTKNQKRKQNRIELEIVVRDLVNNAEATIGVVDSNKNFILKDEEAAAYYNLAQYF